MAPSFSAFLANWQRVLPANHEDFWALVDEAEPSPRETLFDPYAAENASEFFPVISEALFETPETLRAH